MKVEVKSEVKAERNIKLEAEKGNGVKVEKTEASTSSASTLPVPIPFLTDKVTVEEIPTYVVEMSKSARAMW